MRAATVAAILAAAVCAVGVGMHLSADHHRKRALADLEDQVAAARRALSRCARISAEAVETIGANAATINMLRADRDEALRSAEGCRADREHDDAGWIATVEACHQALAECRRQERADGADGYRVRSWCADGAVVDCRCRGPAELLDTMTISACGGRP